MTGWPARWWSRTLVALGAAFVLAQLVPYGRAHDNPPVRRGPEWDDPRTEELARRACFDCHSNETRWPWYSHVAPVSWLVQHDVDDGRAELNLSELDVRQDEADDAAESVEEGEMPPRPYLLTHPEARLSAQERAALIDGLERTLGRRREGERRRGRGHDDDD